MVFPEAKTSRFVHSLGAMHLASRFVVTALENSSREHMQAFLDEVRDQIDWATLRAEELDELLKHSGALDALSAMRFSSHVRVDSTQARDNRRLLALVEGALRLAALFHDLGHLPFSHDLEYALADFASLRTSERRPLPHSTLEIASAAAPHEEIGHALADVVFQLLPEPRAAVRHVYSLARKILETTPPEVGVFQHQPASALQWLHSLVDGEIDVDRADYLLRDGQALGLDFAQYDLDRLVSSMVLIKRADLGFTTAIKEPGLAALESYCLTRSRSHQVFVRHHKVTQVAAALRYASAQLMDGPLASPLLDFLSGLKSLATEQDRIEALRQYSVMDDGWWFQRLRLLQVPSTPSLLSACLGLVLDRTPSLKSLWKRKGDLSPDQVRILRGRTQHLISGEDGRISLLAARRRLLDSGVLLAGFKFKPYVEDRMSKQSAMRILSKSDRLVPATELSPLIRHLRELWEEDIHFFAFSEKRNEISVDQVLDLLTPDASR